MVEEERITLRAGDALRLVRLRYCTSREALADSVAGEAYLSLPGGGLFTRGGPRIRAGCGEVGNFEGSWIVEPGQHRVVIVLMHYFTGTCEVDDRFFFNLDVQ